MLKQSSLSLTLVLLGACVTEGTVRGAPTDSGIQWTYAGPVEKIRQAALDALGEAGFATSENAEIDSTHWRLLGSHETPEGQSQVARVMGEYRESDTLVRIYVATTGMNQGTNRSDADMTQLIHERLARKLGRPAPAPGGVAGKTVDVGIEKLYFSELQVCFDAAVEVVRARDFRLLGHDRPVGDTASIAAQGKGLSITMTLSRAAGNRTRIVVQANGRGDQENHDEALGLINQLRVKLLEPLD